MPRMIKADEVDSTNEWMKRHLDKLSDLDSLIAKVQTSGKGRNGKNWFSPSGGLWFSLLLENFSGNAGALSQLCAVTVCEVLEKQGLLTNIKWPNDIISRGRKLGGILIEKIGEKFIVGIGLNLNLSNSDFSIPLKDIVITSKELLHKDIDVEETAKNIIERIAKEINELEEVHKKYLSLSGDVNEKVRFTDGKDTFIGKVVTVQEDGGIKIKNEEAEKVFYSGSIYYIS